MPRHDHGRVTGDSKIEELDRSADPSKRDEAARAKVKRNQLSSKLDMARYYAAVSALVREHAGAAGYLCPVTQASACQLSVSELRAICDTPEIVAECLDIPDDYAFMDPALVRLLEARVTPHLR